MEKIIVITSYDDVIVREVGQIDYELLSTALDGMVEVVSVSDDIDIWVNEEGKIRQMPNNAYATLLWNRVFSTPDIIAGTMIITGGLDEMGETIGLSDDNVDYVLGLIGKNSLVNN